jgi:predicted dehydrogenase
MKKNVFVLALVFAGVVNVQCKAQLLKKNDDIRLITLDPGHFHAALVQKSMYDGVSRTVYVYAPKGADVDAHLARIDAYNTRSSHPTHWKEEVYLGPDFFNRMITDKKGNVVVMAGNNQNKTNYIKRSVAAGFSVLGDKPMAIDNQHFALLQDAFKIAAKKKLVLYDIMTERYEITNALQREFAQIPAVFGQLKKGTPEHPGVEMQSIHYLYKYVSGKVLTRPDWFFDTQQEGEGLQDVGTHLVDLTQWECFPNKSIDYKKDIQFNSASHWVSDITLSQFNTITGSNGFPAFLKKNVVHDTVLQVYTNGMVNYKLFGVNVRLTALWDYKAVSGGDNQYSVLRGTKANLVIKQGPDERYIPVLYIAPVSNSPAYENQLLGKVRDLNNKYPGVYLKKEGTVYEVIIPEAYKDGHEAHFAKVTDSFIGYLKNGNMPKWEVPNMLAKYYITTTALDMARQADKQNIKPKHKHRRK